MSKAAAVSTTRTRRRCLAPTLLCAALAGGCASLPSLENRSMSHAIEDTDQTRLGATIMPMVAAHPGSSGIYPLRDGRDAFASRVLLAQAAQRTLDAQYYIWHRDLTGTLLFDAILQAADRGVRVRLLLDDNNTSGMDAMLAALDAHPNIEVRLFNPFVNRAWRWTGYLNDFSRLNRRMHNKSFTADNQATVIGGRNIGDEYFGATADTMFVDVDVLTVGPVVKTVSADFDRYWASASAYPAQGLLRPVGDDEAGEIRLAAAAMADSPASREYVDAIRNSPFVHQLMAHTLPMEWADVRLVSDNPDKGLGRATQEQLLVAMLRQGIGTPEHEMDLDSPYFVPTETGMALLTGLARQGLRVRVLTNALEATDVPAVHSGYAKRRKALLEAGVELYELKRMGPELPRPAGDGPGGSSSHSSLHAKVFSVDRSRVFIGSFNFDPRSAQLNTEMGFIMESPALAQQIDEAFNIRVPGEAYRARLAPDGRLYWTESQAGSVRRYDTEPGTSAWQRAKVFFLSLLPIDSLL